MKIEINVDETQFKDILDKELQDLPKEVLQNIIAESIRGYFQQDNYKNVEKIFIQDYKNSYNYHSSKEASDLLRSVLSDCDYSELQSVVDEAIKNLKENYNNILLKVLTTMLVNGLTDEYSFQSAVSIAVTDEMCRRNNS